MSGFDLSLETLKAKFKHALSPRSLSFPDDGEYEIKYMAANGLQTLTKIMASLPVLEFDRAQNGHLTPNSSVFLMSPEFHYKDYRLANFGLDTVDQLGNAAFDIYQQGYQLRQRFSLRTYLPMEDEDSIGVSQCSVKNLYSKDLAANRTEIERCMPGMQDSAPLFLQAEKNRLPGFFSTVDKNALRVTSAFITTRGSYLMGVFLPDEHAIVTFEVSNDQTMNMTPDLDSITRKFAHEWEPEAREIIFMKDRKVWSIPPELDRDFLFFKAEKVLRERIQATFGHELHPARKSKLERAMDDSHRFYEGMLTNAFAAAGGNMPKAGSQYAIASNITMGYIERAKKRRLMELAKEMTLASDMISVPGIKKTMFDVRASDRQSSVPALAHA